MKTRNIVALVQNVPTMLCKEVKSKIKKDIAYPDRYPVVEPISLIRMCHLLLIYYSLA